MTINSYIDYRIFLRDVLESRIRRHARYSLRAFSRDLGLHPARLSDVLNSKKGLSDAAARLLAERLALSKSERTYFCDLIAMRHARSPRVRGEARQRVMEQRRKPEYHELASDQYQLVAEWYHFALLDLVQTSGFEPKESWIARRLGITPFEARQAIERLVRPGYLRRDHDGLRRSTPNLTTTRDVPSEAIRGYHEQILDKARAALHRQPIAERDFSAVTIVADLARIEEAKRRIEQFRRELVAYLESGERGQELYGLSIQLFRLSEPIGEAPQAPSPSSAKE